jgi:hypothetical protein
MLNLVGLWDASLQIPANMTFIIYVGYQCAISVTLEAILPHASIHINKRLENIVGLLGIPILAVMGT